MNQNKESFLTFAARIIFTAAMTVIGIVCLLCGVFGEIAPPQSMPMEILMRLMFIAVAGFVFWMLWRGDDKSGK